MFIIYLIIKIFQSGRDILLLHGTVILHYYQSYVFSRHYCMCIHQLILLQYMFYDGHCICNDQEQCIVIYSNITIMLLFYVIILSLAKGGVKSWDYNKLYYDNNGWYYHLNILPFAQLNTIVNNNIDNTHNYTFFTTTYDSLR